MDVLHAPQTNRRLGVCSFYCKMQTNTNQTLQLGSPEQMNSALVLISDRERATKRQKKTAKK